MPTHGLYGREAELDRIHLLADAVSADRRAAVVSLIGDAGLGKSALLDVATDRLREVGFDVIETGLSEPERRLTWAGLHVAMRCIADEHFAALPETLRAAIPVATGRVAGTTDPALVAFALGELLAVIADDAPLALVIDDLHWLDEASAAAIAFAVRATADRPVLTLMAARPGYELPIEPARLLRSADVHELQLAGLSTASIHHIVDERCGVALRRPDLIRLHELTGGSPLHAIEAGRLIASGRTALEAVQHPTLRAAMTARLEGLSAECIRLLAAAALCSEPTIRLLAAVEPDLDVIELLDRLERDGLVRVRRETVEFTHPLLRSAAENTIGGIERRRLELRLASNVTDPEERVLLLADAATEPDASVAEALDEAAERAIERGALHVAADRFERAARLTEPTESAGRGRRLLAAAEASMLAGDRVRPIRLADEATSAVEDWTDRLRIVVVKAVTVGNRPDRPAAAQLARSALEEFDQPLAVARIQGLLSQALMSTDLRAARAASEAAVAAAHSAGDPDRLFIESARLEYLRLVTGEPVDLDQIARDANAPGISPVDLFDLVNILLSADRIDDALPLAWGVLEEAERIGRIDDAQNAHQHLADLLARAGRFDEAAHHLAAWTDLERVIGGISPKGTISDQGVLLALRGDTAAARALVDDAVALGEDDPAETLCVHSNGAFVGITIGDWAMAVVHGRSARLLAHQIGYDNLTHAPFRAELVEGLVQLGELDEAAEVAEEHRRLADRQPLPRGVSDALRGRALVAAARGDLTAAIDSMEEAIALHADLPVPLERGRNLLASGMLLRRAGRRAAAADRLDEAVATFESIAARPWADRADAERARLGARRRSDGTLTPTEEQIAVLVAAGRTNAEVAAELHVSLRTVESNLTRVYRKLGVRSRAALAATFDRTG